MSASVFPARAGMSPLGAAVQKIIPRVPRASGDEPGAGWYIAATKWCSPRERG